MAEVIISHLLKSRYLPVCLTNLYAVGALKPTKKYLMGIAVQRTPTVRVLGVRGGLHLVVQASANPKGNL